MKSIAAFILAIATGIGLGQCSTARAHDMYGGLSNPVTGVDCCHNQDCKPVETSEVGEAGSDLTWRGAYFPKRQTLQSPDDRYHVCAVPSWQLNGSATWTIRCILRPTPGS